MPNWISCVLAVLLFSCSSFGCALRPRGVPALPKPDADQIIARLNRRTNELKSFKGVGRFKSLRGTKWTTYRIAWVGSQPQNVRVETLGAWGQPVFTFVISGSRLILYSRPDNQYYAGDATAQNLSRFLSMPVKAGDLFRLLSGQPPILPFHRTKTRYASIEGAWFLGLYGRWGRLVEKMWMTEDESGVRRADVFNRWEGLQYRVEFNEFDQVESFDLPHRIMISDQDGLVGLLTVEKFWINVPLPEDAFELEVFGTPFTDFDS